MKIELVLFNPEIPHNTGAIGRLCAGLDYRLHLIRPLGFALTSRYLKRSGMDYWEHVDLTIHDNWEAFLESEQPQALSFASTRGEASLYAHAFRDGEYAVFGSESGGLPDKVYRPYAAQLFAIPMPGAHARSINLANSVSIVAYEAFRQLEASARRMTRRKGQHALKP